MCSALFANCSCIEIIHFPTKREDVIGEFPMNLKAKKHTNKRSSANECETPQCMGQMFIWSTLRLRQFVLAFLVNVVLFDFPHTNI